jgi:hypothetical protein
MSILLSLVALVVIFALLYWLITSAPIPGAMGPVIKWALTAVLVIFAIYAIANLFHIKLPIP